jgi:hypothetical protein
MEARGWTYLRHDGEHIIRSEHGEFRAATRQAAELNALMAENDAAFKAEQAEAHRQMRLEEQRAVIALSDARAR